MILKAIVMDELEVCLSVQQKLFNNISYFNKWKAPTRSGVVKLNN